MAQGSSCSVHLDYADHQVKIFDSIPALEGFRGIKGWVVKRIVGLVVRLNQVGTAPQKTCSRSLLCSIRSLVQILRDRRIKEEVLTARLVTLTARVTEMSQQIAGQQQDFACQSELLAQARNQLAELAQSPPSRSASNHTASVDRAA